MFPGVLIIDDDDSLRELLALDLEEMGIAVLHARKLKDAREILDAFRPGVIVVDGLLPDGRGTDFIASLRGQTPAPRIIFMSAFWRDRKSLTELTKTLGVQHVFAKPFPIAELTAAIRQSLAPNATRRAPR